MLRPATPLTVLLFTSFILLLLAVISTPIVKGIPIAKVQDVAFGVFGYCSPKECSGISVGYTTGMDKCCSERLVNLLTAADGLFDGASDSNFSLPSSARHSLSALLIVHPIAALFNLICLGLAGAAHLHSPSHSARYLLGLLISLLPTLLVTLLAFLVDVLLFVPHLQWGGWIVLASTILITASGVVTCAMRRTLVSRKARKRRIAENAEMSGQNFYSRQSAAPKVDTTSPTTANGEPKMPMVDGAPGANALPPFPTNKGYEQSETRSEFSGRSPSGRTNGDFGGYRGGDGMALAPTRSRSRDPAMGARDEYGNPFSPSEGLRGVSSPTHRTHTPDSDFRRMPSRERTNGMAVASRGGAGYGPPRGGGGYPSRGGYGPPRGGFGGPRGGGGPVMGFARDDYSGGRGRGGPMTSGGMDRSNYGPPPPGYPPLGPSRSFEQSRTPRYAGSLGGPRRPSLGDSTQRAPFEAAPSLPVNGRFLGQAVEMNASTGRMSQAADVADDGEGPYYAGRIDSSPTRGFSNRASPASQYGSLGQPRQAQLAAQPGTVNVDGTYGGVLE
jgi:hypothetical protein